MEKPEWFKQVDASQSAPEVIAPLFAAPQVTRLTKGFAALGVAAVIAAGGFAVTHLGGSASAAEALSSTSAPANASTTSAPVPSAPSGSITATPVSAQANLGAGQPAIGGGKPSITGAGAGGEDD